MININKIKSFLLSSTKSESKKLYELISEWNKYDNSVNEQESYYLKAIYDPEKIDLEPNFIQKKREELGQVIRRDAKLIRVSAPTSFGKTYEIVKYSKELKGIVVFISPTISLCNEYFMNLRNGSEKKISMTPNIDAEIYILTPEKSISLLKKKNLFDLVVFDEFYESFTGNRFSKFKESYLLALKKSKKVITIVPHNTVLNFEGDETKGVDFSADVSTTTRRYNYYIKTNGKTIKYINSELFSEKSKLGFPIKKYDFSFTLEDALIKTCEKIKKIEKQKGKYNVLVLTTKNKMYEIPSKLKKINFETENCFLINRAIQYIKKYSPDTFLEKLLKRGIGYHNGSMDKFLRLLIEKAFEKGEIRILFANSTLTKGVNINPNAMFIDSFSSASQKTKNEKAIAKIEDKNAVGRTGRSNSKNNLIGTVHIFSTSKTSKKIERITGVNSKEKIILNEERNIEPEVIKSFQDLYKKIIANYELGSYYLAASVATKETFELLNIFLKNRNQENASNLVKNIIIIFKMEINPGGLKAVIRNIKNNLLNLGYTNSYINNLKYAKEKYINRNGWISDTKKESYWKYNQTVYDNDILLKRVIDDYQNEAGFFFKQILSMLIENAEINNHLDSEAYKKYEEKMLNEENISTNNGWPDSMANYYIISGKNEKIKNEIDEILNYILKY